MNAIKNEFLNFFSVDPTKKDLNKQRNKVVLGLLIFLCVISTIGMAASQIYSVPEALVRNSPTYLIVTFMAIFIFTNRYTLFTILLSVLATNFVFFSAAWDTRMSAPFIAALIVVSLYQNWKIVLVNCFLYLVALSTFLQKQLLVAEGMYSQNFLFVICSTGFLIFLCVSLEKTRKNFIKQEKEILDSKTMSDINLKKTEIAKEKLLDLHKKLQSNLSNEQQISQEITEGFSNIMYNLEGQNQSVSSMTEKLNVSNDSIYSINERSREITEFVHENNKIIIEGEEKMNSLREEMREVDVSFENTFFLMNELNEKNKQIASILTTLKNISEQTNMLALNASIEAARAGEHGKGFSVVAEEVKKLADHSQKSSKEIESIIDEIQKKSIEVTKKTEIGIEIFDKSQNVMEQLGCVFKQITEKSKDISSKTEENKNLVYNIKEASEEILQESESISSNSQQITAAIEEIMSSMENQSNSLKKLIEETKK